MAITSSDTMQTLFDPAVFFAGYPQSLRKALMRAGAVSGGSIFLVGGCVRDYLLGRTTADIDLAVPDRAGDWAAFIARELGGATVVDLSGPEGDSLRVVAGGVQVDLAAFRGGAATIEEDLCLRDFTINALAVRLPGSNSDAVPVPPLDPMGGIADLGNGLVSHCPGSFAADPLRLLRGYRFAVRLGFELDQTTRAEIRRLAPTITRAAGERINYELELILGADGAAAVLKQMDEDEMLCTLLPELGRGKGVDQPWFHHLDVFDHCLQVFTWVERIIADPASHYPAERRDLQKYLQGKTVVVLKWAALLHDIGKPETKKVVPEEGGRVTFHRHDEVGVELLAGIAGRLRWSRAAMNKVGALIGMHMHPFHLCNEIRRGRRLSKRAALKLCRRAKGDLAGLFVLAMADSLASCGEQKPVAMEEELRSLWAAVEKIQREYITPVETGPKLLTGRDLIEQFGLSPGPGFRIILDELEIARVEGRVGDRAEAIGWVRNFLATNTLPGDGTDRGGDRKVSSCQRNTNGLKRA